MTTLDDLLDAWARRYGVHRSKEGELIVVHAGADFRRELAVAAKSAGRLVIVVVENRVRNEEIAPFLWSLGRVREHVAFGFAFEVLEHAPLFVTKRAARYRAYAIDVTPRTPQARRRLKQAGA
jgi:hypothetical protein